MGRSGLIVAFDKVVAVFGSSQVQPGDQDYEEARKMGRLLAGAGYLVASGGYHGIMEAVSLGAKDAGGRTRGITAKIFDPLPANPWLDEEDKALNLVDRLEKFAASADAYVVLRGGLGTLAELGLTWTLLQTCSIDKRPLVAVGDAWARLFEAFRQHCIIREEDYALVTLARTPEEAVAHINRALRASSQEP